MKVKKRNKIIVFLSIFLLCFAFATSISVYAEGNDTSTNAVEQEEEVTVTMKLNNFLNKWLTPTVSGLLGVAGSLLGYFLYKRKYHVIENAITSGVLKTEKAREEANKELEKTKEVLEKTKAQLESQKEEYKEMVEHFKEELAELNLARTDLTQFKTLVAYLVAGTPELAKNGYATKILKLLDEGEKFVETTKEILTENVGDDNGNGTNSN